MAFPTQRRVSFFEGQRQAFEGYEGMPARVSNDSLPTAARKVLMGRKQEEWDAFIAFRSHYLFEPHFATPAQPQGQSHAQLRRARLEGVLAKCDQTILDELGFLPFSKEGAEALYTFFPRQILL